MDLFMTNNNGNSDNYGPHVHNYGLRVHTGAIFKMSATEYHENWKIGIPIT